MSLRRNQGNQFKILRWALSHLSGSGFGVTFARVAAGSAIVQVVNMGLALLVGVILARALGPVGLGVYSLAIATVAVLSIPTEFGLPTFLMREVAASHVRSDWVHVNAALAWCSRAVFWSGLAVIFIVSTALFLFPPRGNSELLATTLAALPIVLLAGQSRTHEAVMRGINRQVIGQIPMLILRPGIFLLGLVAASCVFGLAISAPRAMLLHSMSMVFVALTITVLCWQSIPREKRRPSAVALDGRSVLSAALPMGMTEGLRVLNGYVAVFLLGYLADPGAVGLFKVADSIGTLCSLPIAILNVVSAPQIARLHAAMDVTRLRKLVSYVGLGMAVGCLALSLPIAVFGGGILLFVFGPNFVGAQAPMLVLCAGYTLAATLGPSVVLMNMTGRERTVTRGIAVSLSTNLLVGTVAISYVGIAGAALGNVTGYLIWYGWLWYEAKRQAQIDTSMLPAARALLAASVATIRSKT